MSATLDKLEGLARKISFEVPAEEVKAAFERTYKALQKNAAIKGFRKGKVPIATIKSVYKDRATQDVLQDLVGREYQAALSAHSLDPIGQPSIDVQDFGEDKAFKFTAEFEVRPEINLTNYENLKVKKEILNITEERITEVLENLRKNHMETATVLEDRPAQEGDVAELDFEGFVDNQPLEGGSAEGHMLELGSNSFIEGFEDSIVGMKPSDRKEVDLKFPDEYHNEEIAGKPVKFKVTLKSIKKKVMPELNDEFAKKFGEFETLGDLETAIRKDLEAGEEQRIREDLKNRVLRVLVEENPVEVPNTLLMDQKKRLIKDVEDRMRSQGMNDQQLKEYKERWDSDFDDTSRFMIQSALLVDALATEMKLHAGEKDIDRQLKKHAHQSGIPLDQLREFYDNPEQRSRLLYQTTEENVIDFLLEKAEVEEVDAESLNKN